MISKQGPAGFPSLDAKRIVIWNAVRTQRDVLEEKDHFRCGFDLGNMAGENAVLVTPGITVYRLMQENVLPTVRIGGSIRVPQRALAQWIEQHTRVGGAVAGVGALPTDSVRNEECKFSREEQG